MSKSEQQIKPIETVYNGYRFRSRLEARWAVFFDAAGIKYEYKPEGFEVNGARYLPDFYLPEFGVYAEVKPSLEKLLEDGEKISKCIKAGDLPLSKGLLILGQIPHVYSEYISSLFDEPSRGNSGVPNFAFLFKHEEKVLSTMAVIIPQMDVAGFGLGAVSGRRAELIAEFGIAYDIQEFPECLPLMMGDDLLFYSDSWCLVKDGIMYNPSDYDKTVVLLEMAICFDKARQARFEHGEKPMQCRRKHER